MSEKSPKVKFIQTQGDWAVLHGPHRISSYRLSSKTHVYINFALSIGFYRLNLSRKILSSVIGNDRAA